MSSSPLARAISICGSQVALAEKIGTSQQRISFWLTKKQGCVPDVAAKFAPLIEKATNGEVRKEDLCPGTFADLDEQEAA